MSHILVVIELSTLETSTDLSCEFLCEVGKNPALQMGELKHREIKRTVWGHAGSLWWRQALKLGDLFSLQSSPSANYLRPAWVGQPHWQVRPKLLCHHGAAQICACCWDFCTLVTFFYIYIYSSSIFHILCAAVRWLFYSSPQNCRRTFLSQAQGLSSWNALVAYWDSLL